MMLPNRRIMIVDDEPRNRKILRLRLERDFELLEAPSGEEALAVIADFKPCLILLDIMMTGIDGYEVTKEIRRRKDLDLVKIVLVSGKAMIEEKLEGYSAGADDYITKPFDGEEIRAKVHAWVRAYNTEAELKLLKDTLEEEVAKRTQQLFKAERMAFIGHQLGEIVHNLKNPLAVIYSTLNIMLNTNGDDARTMRAYAAAERMIDYINNFLNKVGAEGRSSNQATCALKGIVEDELQIFLLDERSDVTLNTEVPGDLILNLPSAYLHQILGNFFKNAKEAMRQADKKQLDVTASLVNSETVQIKIHDSGCGIPSDSIDKIFNASFTTKLEENGEAKGTGLGLAFCKRVILEAGGAVEVESLVGRGTTFIVTLPAAASPAASGTRPEK